MFVVTYKLNALYHLQDKKLQEVNIIVQPFIVHKVINKHCL